MLLAVVDLENYFVAGLFLGEVNLFSAQFILVVFLNLTDGVRSVEFRSCDAQVRLSRQAQSKGNRIVVVGIYCPRGPWIYWEAKLEIVDVLVSGDFDIAHGRLTSTSFLFEPFSVTFTWTACERMLRPNHIIKTPEATINTIRRTTAQTRCLSSGFRAGGTGGCAVLNGSPS